MTTDQRYIERAEEARNLQNQLGALASDEEREILFQEWSPGRKLVTIWNMESGEEAVLPRYIAVAGLNTRSQRSKTGYMWTAHQEQAPEPRVNTIKCFLHPESAERAFLDEIGVSAVCMSEHLASNSSKWEHARNRHSGSYKVYQDEVNRRENEQYRQRQEAQTDAMIAIAGQAADAKRAPGRPRKEEAE